MGKLQCDICGGKIVVLVGGQCDECERAARGMASSDCASLRMVCRLGPPAQIQSACSEMI